jgi:hypothetical protein
LDPKLLGWLASFGFYMLVARLISFGGWSQRLGILLCVAVFSSVLAVGLKYAAFPVRLRTLTRHLARQVAEGGLGVNEAQKLALTIVRDLAGT